MERKDLSELLDQLETSLYRAENGRKDIDLLVALRVLYKLIKDMLKQA